MKFYSYVELSGVVLWGGAYRQKNDKYTHKYIVCVEERFNGNLKKHNFQVVQHNQKNKKVYERGSLLEINGTLKVNSYKEKEEWINQVYIQANEIKLIEE